MRNEDELMIALDIIKTYSEAAKINGDQLNDAIGKIEDIRSDLIKAAKIQAQETVKNEIAEPIKCSGQLFSDTIIEVFISNVSR